MFCYSSVSQLSPLAWRSQRDVSLVSYSCDWSDFLSFHAHCCLGLLNQKNILCMVMYPISTWTFQKGQEIGRSWFLGVASQFTLGVLVPTYLPTYLMFDFGSTASDILSHGVQQLRSHSSFMNILCTGNSYHSRLPRQYNAAWDLCPTCDIRA
jgi:hypothetical protein